MNAPASFSIYDFTYLYFMYSFSRFALLLWIGFSGKMYIKLILDAFFVFYPKTNPFTSTSVANRSAIFHLAVSAFSITGCIVAIPCKYQFPAFCQFPGNLVFTFLVIDPNWTFVIYRKNIFPIYLQILDRSGFFYNNRCF